MFRSFVFFSFLSLFLSGCIINENIITENFASGYRDDEKKLHLDYTLFNYSADSSRIFIKINTEELLYTKQMEDTFRAAFQVYIRVVSSFEDAKLIDTARQTFHVNKILEGTGKRIYRVDFPLPEVGQYIIECNVSDLNKNITETDYINLDNSSEQSRQNFFLHLAGSSDPVFANYLSASDTFSIDYRTEPPRKLFVRYYKRDFAFASPPYSFDVRDQFNYKPDSIFTITTGNANRFVFVKEGMYQLQSDTSNYEGKTIYRFESGFPGVLTPEALIQPLHYLATKKEFDALHNPPNNKQAIDKFWLGIGNDQEHTRTLIKKYYSRVENANRLFTSYMEGWRTDRGMIYIIYGSPHVVNKSSNSESWTYGDPTSSLSVVFNFTKVINPFSDNDYTLDRTPTYETSWYRAIDTWRQGRVFNDY